MGKKKGLAVIRQAVYQTTVYATRNRMYYFFTLTNHFLPENWPVFWSYQLIYQAPDRLA